MPPRKLKEAPPPLDTEDFVRKRDAFVTSMTMLRNAADEASRAGLAYFDLMHGLSNGEYHARGLSAPPGHSFTEEPELNENGKRRRKRTVKPKDPNAPKKPATPFFLFCSEGRGTVRQDMGENTEFKDIQAELRRRWEILPQSEKQQWSDLYQVKLAEWKKVNEAYQTTKANGEAALAAAEAGETPAAPAGGFTAVNHSAVPAPAADATEDEEEDEPIERGVPEPEPEAEREGEVEGEQQGTTDSSLSPPPAERPKTPRGRKPKAKAAEIPASEKKPRKARAKKVEDPAAAAVESPRRKGRKRRKSGTE